MAFLRKCTIILFCYFLFINAEPPDNSLQNSYQPFIESVLNYLNNNPDRLYDFKYQSFVNAYKEGPNVIKLTIDALGECRPDISSGCVTTIFTCEGLIKESNGNYDVHPKSSCHPKSPIDVPDPLPTIVVGTAETPLPSTNNYMVVGRDAYCTGCPMDLNVNVEGITNLVDTALRHIESERDHRHTLVKILRIQRQIVAGVKYVLLIEIAPTLCTKESPFSCPIDETAPIETCEIVYFQKPWISRDKHIIGNNCTTSQDYMVPASSNIKMIGRNDQDNEIGISNFNKKQFPVNPHAKDMPNFDKIAETGQLDDGYPKMSDAHLADLESQIILEPPEKGVIKSNPEHPAVTAEVMFLDQPNHCKNNGDKKHNGKCGVVQCDKEGCKENNDNNKEKENTKCNCNKKNVEDSSSSSSSSEDCDNSNDKNKKSNNSDSSSSNCDSSSNSDSSSNCKSKSKCSDSDSSSSSDSSDSSSNSKRKCKSSDSDSSSSSDSSSKSSSSSSSSSSSDSSSKSSSSDSSSKSSSSDSSSSDCSGKSSSSDSSSKSSSSDSSSKSSSSDSSSKSSSSDCHHKSKSDSSSDSSSSSSSSSSESNDCDHKKRSKRDRRSPATKHLQKIDEDEKDLIKHLAGMATSTLDRIDSDNNKRIVLHILGAKKAILEDGVNYHLILQIGVSRCAETVEEDKVLETTCKENLVENLTKICKVQILISDDKLSPQILKSHCENGKKHHTHHGIRNRRQLAGGVIPISFDDVNVQKHLHSALEQLDSQSESDYKYKINQVLEASSQVVAGVAYHIKAEVILSSCLKSESKTDCKSLEGSKPRVCKFRIWDRPWAGDGVEIKISCPEDRRKRQAGIPGGISPTSADSPQIKKFVDDGLQNLNAQRDDTHTLVKIIEASSQVVSGSLYRIKVELTTCQTQCEANNSKICNIQVWDQPWLPNGRETNITCKDGIAHSFRAESNRKKRNAHERPLLGGAEALSVDSPKVKGFLEATLQRMDLESDGYIHNLIRIIQATEQVVSGKLYKIEAELSRCRKEEECGENARKICNIEIWDQPWLPNGRQTKVKCDDGQSHKFRSKRDITKKFLTGQEDNSSDSSKAFADKMSRVITKDDHYLSLSMFREFMKTYRKSYDTKKKFKLRYNVFRNNLNKIYLLNKHEQGTAKYGPTQFADLTEKEFKMLLGYRQDLRIENDIKFPQAVIPNVELPIEFDWRTKGIVSEVKNQGLCGSCWAFSVTGNIEGQYALKYGKLLEFSEQELVDCDKSDDGCSGGLMDNAYQAIEKLGGLETEQDYPYEGDNEKCHFNKTLVQVQLSGAVNISHNETDMAKWLLKNGPISIAINANAMQFYFGGVSHPLKYLCSPNNLDHGVLIVGYGVHKYPFFNKKLPYWIVKNSWGRSWGQQGYYLVYRGDGTCGLNQTPSSAIVE